MADVKWIKLTTDMFDNRKIKHLRRLPDGDSVVLIWVMLLTMAGRCNANGMIFLTENIPYTPKMLADELDFEENTVRMALDALSKLNMIVTDGDFFSIAGWEEYQNIEGMERIREQTRKRVAKHREKQKLIQCNVTETLRNAIEEEIEIDKDKDKEKDVLPKGNTKRKPSKSKYGEFQHVLLTDDEFAKLSDEFGDSVISKAIKFLDEYIEEKGYKSKSHNLAIRRWVIDAVMEQDAKSKRKQSGSGKQTKAQELDDFYQMAQAWCEGREQS